MTSKEHPNAPVLSTLNRDGSRRQVRPKLSRGRFQRRRAFVGYALIALFTASPYLRLHGRPLVLLDLPRREFTLFGTTFLPTDSMLLMLLLVSIVVSIFLLTALLGRVWCGWACPQTVYLELIYRPIERFFEGSPRQQRALDRGLPSRRRLLKNVVFLLLSAFLAHTFLAYFVGVERLLLWVRRSPFEHPAAFLVMAVTTALMFLDFAWFREQTCIVACPYGRLQSVLLDRQSMIVGYDLRRGEPRGKLRRAAAAPIVGTPGDAGAGDCIDCRACVQTCPTGIDIREGLQLECVGCTQCIDACDAIMTRVGKPRGLIRYTSQDELAGRTRRLLRPRVVIYPTVLALVVGLLALALARRQPADLTLLRAGGRPFALLDGPDGRPGASVSNQLLLKIVNRTERPRRYTITLLDAATAELVAPENPLAVDAGKTGTMMAFVLAPRALFAAGPHALRLRVSDGAGFVRELPYALLGPRAAGGAAAAGAPR
ncbi:MAG: cytochrome c oxidase accessory protein CcoG [Proteobacteria bacterium]|nr:cytochrome c oxidase accessory protein CcoG [Pseudomonadota bacterium]